MWKFFVLQLNSVLQVSNYNYSVIWRNNTGMSWKFMLLQCLFTYSLCWGGTFSFRWDTGRISL